jgi:tRNA-dependent cyclodipeptide synthase
LEKVVSDFGMAGVLIPDVPAIATYRALGYSENRARRDKAIPKGNALRNRVTKAVEKLGYTSDQVRVFDWAREVEPSSLYQEKYTKIQELYERNDKFYNAIRFTTREVLLTSRKQIDNVEEAITTATHYILSELAFLEFLPAYLNVEKVAYLYHKPWPVYEDYIAGKFDGIVRDYLDFLVIKKET